MLTGFAIGLCTGFAIGLFTRDYQDQLRRRELIEFADKAIKTADHWERESDKWESRAMSAERDLAECQKRDQQTPQTTSTTQGD